MQRRTRGRVPMFEKGALFEPIGSSLGKFGCPHFGQVEVSSPERLELAICSNHSDWVIFILRAG